MTKHPPVSIFALQTPEERARTERLAEALEECGPNEVKAAYRRLGLEEPASPEPERALPEPGAQEHSERKDTGIAQWLRTHGAVAEPTCCIMARLHSSTKNCPLTRITRVSYITHGIVEVFVKGKL